MTPGVYRSILVSVLLAGLGAAALAGLALSLAVAAGRTTPGILVAIAAAACLVLIGLWLVGLRLKDHVRRLDRLRGNVLVATAHDEMLSPQVLEPAGDEIGRLAQTLAQMLEQSRLRRTDPDARLAAVVAAAAEGIIVVTPSGLVSLVNAAAMRQLGAGHVLVGTSVYDLFHRSELAAATDRARAARQPVTASLTTIVGDVLEVHVADLGASAGVVVSLPWGESGHEIGIHHDLRLHEAPPETAPVNDGTPLDALPVVVLDTETTGLEVDGDRIVSIGAVRLHGSRIFRHLTLDALVHPGLPIPARATAVHGISDAMVAGAPAVGEVLPKVAEFAAGTVIVGHCVGFDLKMLETEASRSGLRWSTPRSLCTMLLAAGLFSEAEELSLDALAERLGVTVQGRHTALGDALVTAEVYARLVPLLIDAGVTTFGAATALAARPRKIVAQQRAAGW